MKTTEWSTILAPRRPDAHTRSRRDVTVATLISAGLFAACSGCAATGNAPSTANYVFVYLTTGPQSARMTNEQRAAIFEGHIANIHRLADEGKLLIAGPFYHPRDATWRGIFVLDVPGVEEAGRLVATDPGVQAEVFVPELHPFVAATSLRTVPELERQQTATQPASQPAGSGVRGYVMITAQDADCAGRALTTAGLSPQVLWCGRFADRSGAGGVFVLDAQQADEVIAALDRVHADLGAGPVDAWWSSRCLTGLPRSAAVLPPRQR